MLRSLLCVLLLASRLSAAPAPADTLARVRALLDAGQAEEALKAVEPLTRGRNPQPEALLLRSSARILLGEVEPARKDLERALQLDPALRQGWLNLAGLEIAAKRYDAALTHLERAEQLDPAAADNDLNIGTVLLLQGKLEPASARFARELQAHPGSEEAHYLVATNYAMAGYGALAIEHLRRAIALNERTRLRARTDANFLSIENNAAFQQLLLTDSYTVPADALRAQQLYALPYDGDGKLLAGVIAALQALRQPFDPRVEVTPDWALIWGEFRIKLAAGTGGKGLVEVTAPGGTLTPAEWQRRTERLFREILLRLPA